MSTLIVTKEQVVAALEASVFYTDKHKAFNTNRVYVSVNKKGYIKVSDKKGAGVLLYTDSDVYNNTHMGYPLLQSSTVEVDFELKRAIPILENRVFDGIVYELVREWKDIKLYKPTQECNISEIELFSYQHGECTEIRYTDGTFNSTFTINEKIYNVLSNGSHFCSFVDGVYIPFEIFIKESKAIFENEYVKVFEHKNYLGMVPMCDLFNKKLPSYDLEKDVIFIYSKAKKEYYEIEYKYPEPDEDGYLYELASEVKDMFANAKNIIEYVKGFDITYVAPAGCKYTYWTKGSNRVYTSNNESVNTNITLENFKEAIGNKRFY